jgi:Nif11 domain
LHRDTQPLRVKGPQIGRKADMASGSQVSDFMKRAKTDQKLIDKIFHVLEKHGKAQAEEILSLAREEGFSFTTAEFEETMLSDMNQQFSAAKETAAQPAAKPVPKPPMSSCARGCLSWTVNYCPIERL